MRRISQRGMVSCDDGWRIWHIGHTAAAGSHLLQKEEAPRPHYADSWLRKGAEEIVPGTGIKLARLERDVLSKESGLRYIYAILVGF